MVSDFQSRSIHKDIIWWIILAIAIIVHLAMILWFDFTQDDAFITFRYAANFVDGHGLVFNAGERVEGYTNFFWLIIMIIGLLCKFDILIFSKLIGAICSSLTLIVIFMTGRDMAHGNLRVGALAGLMLGLIYSFGYWAGAGLETAAFTLMVTLAVYFYYKGSFMVIPALIVSCLLRPEGVLILLFIMIYDILSSKKISRHIVVIISACMMALLPYAVFKYIYYGGLLPNPFYAKTDFTLYKYWDGLKYIGEFFWHYWAAGLFLLPILLLLRREGRGFRLMAGLVAVYFIYIIAVGGDVLKVHRFFIPVLPLMILLVVYSLSRLIKKHLILASALAVIIAWQLLIPLNYVKSYHLAEKMLTAKMSSLGRDLAATDSRDFSLATTTIGAIGYHLPGHHVYDMLGLTDTVIARYPEKSLEGITTTWRERRYNTPYLLSRQPDYILFSTGRKPSAPAEKMLQLYSVFQQNYRTVTYEFNNMRHDIFKRYYKIGGNIRRDINVSFIGLYDRGFELFTAGQYTAATGAFREASKYVPDTVCSYVRYCIAESLRKAGDHEASYQLLKELSKSDSLTYEIFLDLFVYEYSGLRDYEKADYYHKKLEKLIPWYLPRLDAKVEQLEN
ncbi:MAG: hypothetical protein AB1746_10680 [Candidatus Zixiibacteriota bacterium]